MITFIVILFALNFIWAIAALLMLAEVDTNKSHNISKKDQLRMAISGVILITSLVILIFIHILT